MHCLQDQPSLQWNCGLMSPTRVQWVAEWGLSANKDGDNNNNRTNLTCAGHRYLLRAKFTNDSYFLVREIGRGRGVRERSLEMTEVSREGGRR